MGLDTTHDCWHGAYSAFHRWRTKLAEVAGLPPLDKMDGFERDDISITWSSLKYDVLHILLNHSDCDGSIPHKYCRPLAERLKELLPALDELPPDTGHIGVWRDKTQQFIDGLLLADGLGEDVEFQ